MRRAARIVALPGMLVALAWHAGAADQAPPGSAEAARAFLAAGEKAVAEADFPKAIRAYQEAEAAARRAGDESELARALGGRAGVLFTQGELARALEVAGESLRVRERGGGAAEQADAWNTLGHIRHARAEYPEAFAAYRRALDLWTSAGDRGGAARALNNIGNIHRGLSELDEALRHYEQALRTFEETGDRRSAAVVTGNIGLIHFNRGEYPQALEYCTRSLAMNEAVGDRIRIAKSLDSLGNIHRAQGAYARALDSFHRSLRLAEQLGLKFQMLETWNNIGLVHFSQGDYRLAIDAYKRGLRLNKEMGGATLVPEGLYNIAAAAWRLGERRRAEANYRESLRISERGGFKWFVAANLHDLGRIALEAGRHAEAGRLMERALDVREGMKDQAGIAESLNGLASLRLAAGRPGEALDLARRSAGIARTFEQPELLWEAETLSGVAHLRLGQADAARRSFDEAIGVIEGLRLQVVGRAQGRERFFESKLSPYHEIMALALARGSPVNALELAERSKARALADLMQSRADVAGVMSEGDRREEGRLRAGLVSLNLKIEAERAREAPDPGRLASLESERETKRSAYETFEAAAYAQHPELSRRRGRPVQFTFAEAGRLLPDASVALLEYAVTEEGSWLFVLARGADGVPRLDSYALKAGRRSLAERAGRFRERLASRSLAYAADARALHDVLLAPARVSLQGRTHLVVVPDGPLWDVPFQALQDAAGRHVIESAAVSYAPSLTVLRETLKAPARNGQPRTLLAMGKADSVVALPEAERQIRLIAALYDPDRRSAYFGPDAREDYFKAEAPRRNVVHLASHGVLEPASPLYSHVVLSPGPSGSSEDGLLEAREVLDMKLDADLVVLSACETGRGRLAPGEGIVGTMWAFFVAGSRALLVSQWKVESASTTELMTAFHRGFAPGSGSKAGHLRQASLELLRQPRYAHPFYWAGFVLVGNPY